MIKCKLPYTGREKEININTERQEVKTLGEESTHKRMI